MSLNTTYKINKSTLRPLLWSFLGFLLFCLQPLQLLQYYLQFGRVATCSRNLEIVRAHYWYDWRFGPEIFVFVRMVLKAFFWSTSSKFLHFLFPFPLLLFFFLLLPVPRACCLAFRLLELILLKSLLNFLAAQSQSCQILLFSISLLLMNPINFLKELNLFLLIIFQLILFILSLLLNFHPVFLTRRVNIVKFIFPIVKISFLMIFWLNLRVSPSLHLLGL